MSCNQPQAHPDRCGCAPHGTEQVSSAWLAQLREEYRLFGEQNELLAQRCGNLEAVQQASLERSGTIKAAAGQLGWNADREDGPLEFLIKQARRCVELEVEINRQAEQFREWQASHHANYAAAARERDTLRAEVEELRKDAERYRWARRPESGNILFTITSAGGCGPSMDSDIDAAMAAKEGV